MSPSEPLVVEYQLSEDELVSFLSEGLARSRLYRILWPQRRLALGFSFIVIVMAVSLALGLRWWTDYHARLIAAALFGLAVFLLSAFDQRLTAWFLRPRLRRGRYAWYLRPIRLEIGPAQISAKDRETGATYSWPATQGVRAVHAGVVIYLVPSGTLLVPRRAFDEPAAFVYFLNAAHQLRRAKG